MSGHSESDGSGDSGVMQATGPSRDAVKKLDQIIQVCSQNPWEIVTSTDFPSQNFHTKAAILILQSRMSLPVIILKDGTKKVNKWVRLSKLFLRDRTNNDSFKSRPTIRPHIEMNS